MSAKPKTEYIRRQGGFGREEWLAPKVTEAEAPKVVEIQVRHLSDEEDAKMLAGLYEEMAPQHHREFWTLGGATEAAKRAYLFRWGYLAKLGGGS